MAYPLRHIAKGYAGRPVLTDVSLTLPEAGVRAIMGASGSGKTTLLMILAGLLEPDAGDLAALAGVPCAMVFQEDRLLDWASATDNVTFVLPGPRSETAPAARALLTELGLGDSLDKQARDLSGGMRRRVALARALASDSRLLLLDEPYQGLDEGSKAAAVERITGAARERCVLLVTHDEREARRLDAPVLTLRDGVLAVNS